jgi:hypothetical protein
MNFLAKNKTSGERAKYFCMQYHFIREKIESGHAICKVRGKYGQFVYENLGGESLFLIH